jgi:hypothetical protein
MTGLMNLVSSGDALFDLDSENENTDMANWLSFMEPPHKLDGKSP